MKTKIVRTTSGYESSEAPISCPDCGAALDETGAGEYCGLMLIDRVCADSCGYGDQVSDLSDIR